MNSVPLRRDARWVVTLVLTTLVAYALVSFLSFVWLFEEASSIPEHVLAAMRTSSMMQLVLYIAGAVMWALWQRRLNLRLRAAGREGMRFTPGWTIGWYFVPFANLFMPSQVMQEMWQASDPSAGPTDWKATPQLQRIYTWWGLFVFANVISRLGFSSAMSGENTGALVADPVSAVFIVAAGILAIGIIRRIEARMSVIEGATEVALPEPSSTGGLIGAALAGIALGIVWFVVMLRVLLLLRLGADLRPAILILAIAMGAGLGWLMVQASARRDTAVMVTAGIAGVVGTTVADMAARQFSPIMFLRALQVQGMPVMLSLLRGMTEPFALGVMVLTAGAAVAMAYFKVPMPLWFLPGEPARGQQTSGVGIVPPPPPPGSHVGIPTAAVTPPPPTGASTVAPTPPPPPPAVAPLPQTPAPEAHSTVASTLPPPPPALAEAARPASTVASREKLKIDPKYLWGAIAGVVLVALLIGAFALGRGAGGPDRSPSETSQAEQEQPRPAPSEAAPDPGYTESEAPEEFDILLDTPRGAVEELYRAAGIGDEEAARETFTFGFEVEPGTFENWGNPDWEVRDIVDQADGDCLIEIYEPDGGFSADRDVVTWITREDEDGGWLISGWWLGAAKDYKY